MVLKQHGKQTAIATYHIRLHTYSLLCPEILHDSNNSMYWHHYNCSGLMVISLLSIFSSRILIRQFINGNTRPVHCYRPEQRYVEQAIGMLAALILLKRYTSLKQG